MDEQQLTALETIIDRIVRKVLEEQRGSSVDLTRNAKGEVQIGVKEYRPSTTEASSIAQATFDELCRKYPSPK